MSYLVNPYMVTAGETIIYEQLLTPNNMYNFESINVAGGLHIKSGSSLIGESLNKVTFAMSYVNGLPVASTLYARVFNTGSALTVKHEFGSMATNTLTTSTATYEFQSGSSYTLAQDDVISIYADQSSTSYPNNMILQAGVNSDETYLNYADYNSSIWATGGRRPYIILAEA